MLEKEMPGPLKAYKASIDGLLKLQNQLMGQAADVATASVQGMLWIVALASLIAIALGVVLAWSIIRSIIRPLHQAVGVANAVADGDLTHHIDASGNSETAHLLQALRRTQEGLIKVVSHVRQDSDGVATASAKSPRATRTCQRAPKARPARWSRPLPRWKSSTPPCARTRTTHARPTSWRRTLPASRARAARWWPTWCAP